MFLNSFLVMLALAACSFQTATQADKRVQRQDSVTVSAGISKEQLALEEKLDEIISQADLARRSGKAANAIKQYENALDLVHKQPLLGERENYVLHKLADGYVRGDRAKDAVSIYSQLVAAKKRDCESASAAVSSCADAQYSLGIAKMNAGDLLGALSTLRDAEANYAKAEKLTGLHEFTVIQVKEQAQTKLYIAVTLFQLGERAEAIANVEAAIPQLSRVQSDETILVGIRDDAGRSLRDAQTLLKRLKEAQ